MKKNRLAQGLRLFLSFVIATTAPAISYAADANGMLKTGGGQPPINNPPPTTFSGAGDQPEGPKKSNSGNSSANAGNFNDLWAVDSTGTEIRREGKLDAQGRIQVYKQDGSYIRRGVVVEDATHPDGYRVQWLRGFSTLQKLVKELKSNSSAQKPTYYEMEIVFRRSHIFLEPESTNSEVHYQGQRDTLGRELVFRRHMVQGKVDPSVIETGVQIELGNIQWNSNAISSEDFVTNIANSGYRRRADLNETQKDRFAENIKVMRTENLRNWILQEASKPQPGQIFKKIGGKTLYYEGRLDATTGRPLVYTFTPGTNGEQGVYQRALVDYNGEVVWFKYPGSNYAAQPSPTEPIPASRALVITDGKTETHRSNGGASENAVAAKDVVEKPSLWTRFKQKLADFGAAKTSSGTTAQSTPVTTTATQSNPATTTATQSNPATTTATQSNPTTMPASGSNLTAPIPHDHALTVTDGLTHTSVAAGGSGQSEISSPQKEVISRPAPTFRPSNLNNALEWTQAKTDQLKDLARRTATGENSPLDFREANKKANAEFATSGAARIGAGMAAFYVGMGIMAAFTIMHDYPNNPVALEKYLSTLTDPVGWMMMAGFMAAAGPFMQKVGGFSSGKAIIRTVPLFAAGMLAGALVQGLMMYASDPDVIACTGAKTFNTFHTAQRDISACDKAYDKLSAEQITLTFLPALTNLMAAGGIYLGVQFVSSVTGLTSLIRSLPLLKGPKAGAIGMVAGAVLFLGAYQISTDVVGTEKLTREYLLASHTFSSNAFGSTIDDSESKLYQGWSDLKKRNWVDLPAADVNKTCFYNDVTSVDVPSYACPDPIDFTGTLKRYSQLQGTWRSVQMADTMTAYNQWLKKVQDYHETLNGAFTAYQDFVSRIEFENKNPGLAANDPRGFNAVTISNLQRTQSAAFTALGDPLFTKDFSGVWPHVETTKLYDYVVASMACGPETDGFGPADSWWQSSKHFVSKWTSGNVSPDHLIDNPYGSAIKFYPPRLTNPIEGTRSSICEYYIGSTPSLIPEPLAFLSPSVKWTPQQFAVLAPLFSGQKNYRSLYDYIKDNVRPTVLSGGQNTFREWWRHAVTAQVIDTENKLYEDYAKMINTTYREALIRNDYYRCDLGNVKGNDFATYLAQLPVGQSSKCAEVGLHHLSYGVMNSMRDEMRLYMAMLMDLYASTHKGASPAVLEASRKVLTRFNQMMTKLTIVDADVRGDVNVESDALGDSYVALLNLVLPSPPTTPKSAVAPITQNIAKPSTTPKAAPTATTSGSQPSSHTPRTPQDKIAIKLLTQIGTLITQGSTYYSILTGISHLAPISDDSLAAKSDTTKASSGEGALVPPPPPPAPNDTQAPKANQGQLLPPPPPAAPTQPAAPGISDEATDDN